MQGEQLMAVPSSLYILFSVDSSIQTAKFPFLLALSFDLLAVLPSITDPKTC